MNFKELYRLTFDQNKTFLQSNQRVALGLSGGVDSTALFYVFCEFVKNKIISDFVVLHVHYGLRGEESEGDFRFCRDLADQNGVPFFSLDCSEKTPQTKRLVNESTQVWARRIRHAWFQEFQKQGYFIALAHTANDLAENVLFRMARGSRPENLAGMSRQDGALWRPFISFLRSDLEAAMTGAGRDWREDSSNSSRKYARNRIRHDVLAELEGLFPGAARRIALMAEELAAQGSDLPPLTSADQDPHLASALRSHDRSRQKVDDVRAFMDAAKPGQALDIGNGFILAKRHEDKSAPSSYAAMSPRALQHLQSIDGVYVNAVTTGLASIYVADPAASSEFMRSDLNRIEIMGQNDQQSIEVAMKPPKSEDKVTFAQSTSTFKFKDLMQKWKIAVSDRIRFVGVSTSKKTDTQLVNLFQSGYGPRRSS